MKYNIDHAIEINASTAIVWSQLSNLENLAMWQQNVEGVTFLNTLREGQGTRLRLTQKRGNDLVIEITTWYDGIGYEYKVIDGEKYDDNLGRIRLQQSTNGCIVQWAFQYDAQSGFLRSGPSKRKLDKQIVESLRNLYTFMRDMEDPNIESKAMVKPAPTVEERSRMRTRDNELWGQDQQREEFTPPPLIEEPPYAIDDTKPNPAIQEHPEEQPNRLEEPSFLNDVPYITPVPPLPWKSVQANDTDLENPSESNDDGQQQDIASEDGFNPFSVGFNKVGGKRELSIPEHLTNEESSSFGEPAHPSDPTPPSTPVVVPQLNYDDIDDIQAHFDIPADDDDDVPVISFDMAMQEMLEDSQSAIEPVDTPEVETEHEREPIDPRLDTATVSVFELFGLQKPSDTLETNAITEDMVDEANIETPVNDNVMFDEPIEVLDADIVESEIALDESEPIAEEDVVLDNADYAHDESTIEHEFTDKEEIEATDHRTESSEFAPIAIPAVETEEETEVNGIEEDVDEIIREEAKPVTNMPELEDDSLKKGYRVANRLRNVRSRRSKN